MGEAEQVIARRAADADADQAADQSRVVAANRQLREQRCAEIAAEMPLALARLRAQNYPDGEMACVTIQPAIPVRRRVFWKDIPAGSETTADIAAWEVASAHWTNTTNDGSYARSKYSFLLSDGRLASTSRRDDNSGPGWVSHFELDPDRQSLDGLDQILSGLKRLPRGCLICALATVVDRGGASLLISAGEGTLRSSGLDGAPGGFALRDAHSGWISDVSVVEYDDAPMVISGGTDGALRSWRLDGSPGNLDVRCAHPEGEGGILALAVVEFDGGAPTLLSAGSDGALRSWRVDGAAAEPLVGESHPGPLWALAVARDVSASVIIGAGFDGGLRSWGPGGSRGNLWVSDQSSGSIRALAVVEHEGAPLVISAGVDRPLRSWRLDGSPGSLSVDDAHEGRFIRALAVVEHEGAPLVISAGDDGALRSWRLDGTPGSLNIPDAHSDMIWALTVIEHEGVPLVISAGNDHAVVATRITDGRHWHIGL